MSVVRQDAWGADDDLILAELTLRHIREGSTQLNAFEEVGRRIGRTAAACGFRWNSYVRKKYEAAIQIAKSQRQKRNQQKKQHSYVTEDTSELSAVIASYEVDEHSLGVKSDVVMEDSMSIDAVIRFLKQWKGTYHDVSRRIKILEKQLKEKETELLKHRQENERLHKEVNEVQTDYSVINDDYKALIQIMDRARKMQFLVEEKEEHKPRFKMDANGNLERIE